MRRGTIRRYTSTLLALALGLVYLVPYLIGIFIEQQVNEGFYELERESRGLIGVRPIGYTRGWFESQSSTMLTLQRRENVEPLQVTVNGAMTHGWVGNLELLYRATFTPQLDEGFVRASGLNLPEVPFALTREMDTQGGTTTSLLVSPYHGVYAGELPLQVSWGAADGRVERAIAGRTMAIEFRLPTLRLRERTTEIALRDLAYRGDLERIDAFLWQGSQQLSLEDLHFMHRIAGKEHWLQLVRPHTELNLTPDGKQFNLDLAFGADALRLNSQVYGDLRLALTLHGINESALSQFNLELYNRLLSIFAPSSMGLPGVLRSALHSLSSTQPELEVKEFSARTPDGLVNANLRARLLPVDAQTAPQLEAQGELLLPRSLMYMLLEGSAGTQAWHRRLDGGGRVQTRAEVKAMLLERLLLEGLVTRAGDGLLVKFRYSDGTLLLNGRDPSAALNLQ